MSRFPSCSARWCWRQRRKRARPGTLKQTAITIAEIPDTVRALLREDTRIQAPHPERFAALTPGWNAPGGAALPNLPGYLLLSRYDGDARRHVTELVSLSDWQVQHHWSPDATALLKDADRSSEFVSADAWNTTTFREIHSVLLPDGNLIIKDHGSPLLRIDSCAKPLWMLEGNLFHHSSELSAAGTLWVPARADPQVIDHISPKFYDDEVAEVSLDGKLLFTRSVTQLLLDNGFAHRLFANGMYNDDPIHLNDIEPALADGPFWNKGDVFLSLRNISTILLYRPSTDAIIWMQEGPWIAQHDVDILDDHRISIYDNHAEDRGWGEYVEANSDVKIYDFTTDKVTDFLAGPMAKAGVKTLYAGLYTAMPGGYSLIEDVTNAQLLVFAPDGSLSAEYANKAATGRVFHLGWSRYIDQATGDAALAAIRANPCDP